MRTGLERRQQAKATSIGASSSSQCPSMPPSLLSSLPPEVASFIYDYIDTEDVVWLWLTGEKKQQQQMGSGAVASLSFIRPLFFPLHLLSVLRPKKVSIQGASSSLSPLWYLEGMCWAAIPASVRELDLGLPNAFSAAFSRLPLPPSDHSLLWTPTLPRLRSGRPCRKPSFVSSQT